MRFSSPHYTNHSNTQHLQQYILPLIRLIHNNPPFVNYLLRVPQTNEKSLLLFSLYHNDEFPLYCSFTLDYFKLCLNLMH